MDKWWVQVLRARDIASPCLTPTFNRLGLVICLSDFPLWPQKGIYRAFAVVIIRLSFYENVYLVKSGFCNGVASRASTQPSLSEKWVCWRRVFVCHLPETSFLRGSCGVLLSNRNSAGHGELSFLLHNLHSPLFSCSLSVRQKDQKQLMEFL